MKVTEIPRLTVEDLKARLDRGDALILVDVRKESVYARGHIPGATCVPVTDFAAHIARLPAGKSLVFY
ncbi:MAG: rhodanese-like domain-containing protein [candidate division NC10 bacterium]|nr:rhodanese-like domain-containing protein [candidate division NC10 bacterium]